MIDWHQDGSFTELQTKLSILRRVQSNSLQTHFKIELNSIQKLRSKWVYTENMMQTRFCLSARCTLFEKWNLEEIKIKLEMR